MSMSKRDRMNWYLKRVTPEELRESLVSASPWMRAMTFRDGFCGRDLTLPDGRTVMRARAFAHVELEPDFGLRELRDVVRVAAEHLGMLWDEAIRHGTQGDLEHRSAAGGDGWEMSVRLNGGDISAHVGEPTPHDFHHLAGMPHLVMPNIENNALVWGDGLAFRVRCWGNLGMRHRVGKGLGFITGYPT